MLICCGDWNVENSAYTLGPIMYHFKYVSHIARKKTYKLWNHNTIILSWFVLTQLVIESTLRFLMYFLRSRDKILANKRRHLYNVTIDNTMHLVSQNQLRKHVSRPSYLYNGNTHTWRDQADWSLKLNRPGFRSHWWEVRARGRTNFSA